MATNIEVNSIQELFDEIAKDMDAIARGIASEASDRMILKAPKHSGALAASIKAGVNQEIVQFNPGEVDFSATQANNRTAIMAAQAGDQINIVVGAPYGQEIEEGDANHAPHGFIASTGNELDAINAAVIRDIDRYRK